MTKQNQGFSFIELMVVLSVLAILASLLFPLLEVILLRQKEAALKQGLADIRQALDAYQQASRSGVVNSPAESGYPTHLQELLIQKDAAGRAFLRAMPADPFHPDSTVAAAATWRLRAYNSAPEDPQEGSDIFDVYSSSDRRGSNGLPYSKW